MTHGQFACLCGLIALLSAGCAPASRSPSGDNGSTTESRGPKRITISTQSELTGLRSQIMTVSPGLTEVEQVINAGLAAIDHLGVLHPRLAETVPTIENGLWRVYDDGRMETTWVLRPGAKWHDGAAFTSADVQFTVMQVGKDRELAIFRHLLYDSIDAVDTPDEQTVVVRWSRVNIDADKLLSTLGTPWPMPMPRHILERVYIEEKMSFIQHPYWGPEFIGTGPFKVRDWVIGSHITLQANPDYVHGRPRLDEIEVRFLPDQSALAANIIAGSVDLSVGRGLSLEQALDIRALWQAGDMDVPPRSVIVMYPQLINPTQPAVMSDVRFRRAALHAIDRQALVDTLMRGQSSVTHVFFNPNEPEFREIESSIVRYDYDPRTSMRLIEEIGYTRGGDGVFARGGQPLSVHFQTVNLDVQTKSILSIADWYKQAGMTSEVEILTPQRVDDREYRATRPGFELTRTSNELSSYLTRNHGLQTPLPENNFRSYTNKSRYMNAEHDALIDRYFATIPWKERNEVLAKFVHHLTENLIVLGLFYDVEPMAISDRLLNLERRKAELSSPVWNAHEWDVKPQS